MQNIPAIHVAPVDARLRPELLRLQVRPEQCGYVGTIADLLADTDRCADSEPMAILCGDAVVGFYRIEPNARSVAGHDFDLPALGLRAFFIDACRQGRGLGTLSLAAVIADLAGRHRRARRLVLVVETGNLVALRLYRRGGFVDGGELYHGGRSGPQLLLLRDLP